MNIRVKASCVVMGSENTKCIIQLTNVAPYYGISYGDVAVIKSFLVKIDQK